MGEWVGGWMSRWVGGVFPVNRRGVHDDRARLRRALGLPQLNAQPLVDLVKIAQVAIRAKAVVDLGGR